MTTNWTPASSPSLVRMASGMTTWPLEDILVVRLSDMAGTLPVGRTLAGDPLEIGGLGGSTCTRWIECAMMSLDFRDG